MNIPIVEEILLLTLYILCRGWSYVIIDTVYVLWVCRGGLCNVC